MVDAREIKEIGREFGIDEIKITTAEPLTKQFNRTKQQIKQNIFLGTEYWQETDVKNFFDPGSKLDNAKTVIVACEGYLSDEKEDQTGYCYFEGMPG